MEKEQDEEIVFLPSYPPDQDAKSNKTPTQNKKLTHQNSIKTKITMTDVPRCTLSLDTGHQALRNPLQKDILQRMPCLEVAENGEDTTEHDRKTQNNSAGGRIITTKSWYLFNVELYYY